MRGAGRLITGSVRASARIVGQSPVSAWAVPSGIGISARATDKSSIMRYLRVTPTEPQTLIWLVPQYGVDYHVESNQDWIIK